MKKTLAFPILGLALALGLAGPAPASPADIVPRGSALLDAFATLARADAFGADDTPEDFLGEPLYTRAQLARRLEHLVQEQPKKLAEIQEDPAQIAALHAALTALQPELTADGVDMSEVDLAAGGTSVSGYIQPEVRLRTGGDRQPGNGAFGVYRVTALGSLRSNLRYVLSASNWAQDDRRVFSNDIGAHDFSAVNEAYLELNGGRGLKISLGRMYNRWGPGYRGATQISDNAPAFDQLQVAFPFSLGSRFGRDYQFTQFISTFKENGERKYMEGRRIEYAFSPHLALDFQESFKSTKSKSLYVTFLPDFYTGQSANLHIKGLRLTGLDDYYNADLQLGLTYAASADARAYLQFDVDDIQSPGHQSFRTPRKIAYLVGTTVQVGSATSLTGEYTFADPTTYSSRIPDTQWQKGLFDEIGLPTGPNSREVFLRAAQRIIPGLTFSVQGRDRKRRNDNFPMPESRDLAATVEYAPNPRSGIALTLHDYRQNAFPLDPSVPVPGDGFTPANAEGNYGQTLRLKELDVAYRFYF